MADPKSHEMAPASRAPLLDLNTLVIRPLVRIDGVAYEMRGPDELSILENHRLLALGKRAEAIEEIQDPTEADHAEYQEVLSRICRTVLLAPAEVLGRLLVPQRAAVALTFSRLWLMASLRTTRAIVETTKAQIPTAEPPTTGGPSSPPSSGPTEAPR